MNNLTLRPEFRGSQIKGTTIDFDPQAKSGVLKVPAADFLKITYPSHDLLKLIEAIQPQRSRPVVVLGDRGRGKSHLLATIYHLCNDPQAGKTWLDDWATQLNDARIRDFTLCTGRCIIGESLHHQRYKFLWDLIFAKHPAGQRILGKWEAISEKIPGEKTQTGVPNIDLLRELFAENPTILILDEFQTWYDGLTDTKQYPWKKWAFNFIQILSEIAEKEPNLLTLIVSIRDNQSEAYRQIHRVNPVRVDFKGDYSKIDRRRLLLHRIFENRRQISPQEMQQIFSVHLDEFFRLFQIPQADQETHRREFLETWPYSPSLLKLLDDQVLVATDAQETRDLIRILVDLFKNAVKQPIITAADFSLTNEKSGVASLLDSVANPSHRKLREVAMHNLDAVKATSTYWQKEFPHCEELIGALWLRSLTMDNSSGALADELQLDITRSEPLDDNTFSGELTSVRECSFNIHEIAGRFLFRTDENPQAKLLAHAKNNKIFEGNQDVDFLTKQIKYVLDNTTCRSDHLIVMKPKWRDAPWANREEADRPDNWDSRLTTIIIPEFPDDFNKTMGTWLKQNMPHHRNVVRFLFPCPEYNQFYDNKSLMIQARTVYLAGEWSANSPEYKPIKEKQEKELRAKIKEMFDRYALLNIWNYQEPAKCRFRLEKFQARGEMILETIDKHIRDNLFIPEDFEEYLLLFAKNGESVDKLLKELREPRTEEKPCIPWIGEESVKDKLTDLCAAGKIAINVCGTIYQAMPGEEYDFARSRIRGKIGAGRELAETTLYLPDPGVTGSGSGENTATTLGGTLPSASSDGASTLPDVVNPFTGQPEIPPDSPRYSERKSSEPTSGLNLIGRLEQWGIAKITKVAKVSLHTEQMTGAQLEELLKKLPDGLKYSLELDKEAE